MPSKSDHSSSSFAKSQVTFSMSNDDDDDDDFQNPTHHYSLPLTQTNIIISSSSSSKLALKPSNRASFRLSKKPKPSLNPSPGKENIPPPPPPPHSLTNKFELDEEYDYCSLDAIPSSFDDSGGANGGGDVFSGDDIGAEKRKKGLNLKVNESSYLANSIESRLLNSRVGCNFNEGSFEVFEPGTQLDVLLKLCTENEGHRVGNGADGDCLVLCPLCQTDISDLSEESRQVHTNNCLDEGETQNVVMPSDDPEPQISRQVVGSFPVRLPGEVVDVSPVLDWLCNLGLGKYEEAFIREEVDWDTLQWLSEEDLVSIGITALGPRKKIVHALNDLRRGTPHVPETNGNVHAHTDRRKRSTNGEEIHPNTSNVAADDTGKSISNKLITDFFPGSVADKNKGCTSSKPNHVSEEGPSKASRKRGVKKPATNGKVRDVPLWCCIPGTPFRVDAFRFLRRECSHWFLTHFHIDHYQGLTRSFGHGTIYCSLITAKLVNMKIGIPWDKLQVLPLNQKISIAGINVTCLDANHCPGSIIILFEPPNGKAILHTGDFRFSEAMTSLSVLQSHPIHTLILDTTYCNPEYDFPKQEAVIQFVIEAIQAEAFNPKTLFLIGSYTIGKERLFLEVARVLRKKVYVNASKLRLLKCLGFPEEDMQWFTLNEHESHIHVVPMWTLASFKRLKHISNQYAGRFNLIVAFSPTGWTFGKGKKKSPGRRWQQGTLIRYEVPYSEHSSFTELREFVKFISPSNIIPSVNNDGPESANNMVALLLS